MPYNPMRSLRRKRSAEPGHTQSVPAASRSVFRLPNIDDWYHPVVLGPLTLAGLSTSSTVLRQVIEIAERLESDAYLRYLLAYYNAGLERFGDAWQYADIATVLLAAAQLVRPESYLEIGVRRGRSMAMVAATCPACDIVGFDIWIPDYAGMPNPGPDFVRSEMTKLGHQGDLQLLSGDSHETIPAYLAQHPDSFFDLVSVDGDHSRKGAKQDLRDILPRIKVGGVLVFDDICHPSLPYLADIWRRVIVADGRFATWEFVELGYGVACAIRRDA